VIQWKEDHLERVVLDCREGFRDPGTREKGPFQGWLCEETTFRVQAAMLDHKIPSMAFCLVEPQHIQILKGRLASCGLSPGPWLRTLREAILRGEGDDWPVEVSPPHKGPRPLGWLRDHLVGIRTGQRIAYVVDAGCGEANRQRIISLVRGANLLFIEAPFLEEDRERADATAHLTAFQAGRLAAEAGVQRVVPFHFSPKYEPDATRLLAEVEAGYRSIGGTRQQATGNGQQ